MVTSDPASEPTDESAGAPTGPQGVDDVAGEEVEDAAAILAQGVAVATSIHADAAGVLEAGTAASAHSIAQGAGVIQATAHDHAREAAQAALNAVEAVTEALRPGGGEASLTPEQAMLVVAKASEASAQLATAAKASGAFAAAAVATGLATQAADFAGAFELHMVATAVAARELAQTAADAPGGTGTAEVGAEPSSSRSVACASPPGSGRAKRAACPLSLAAQ